jgi:predicted cupin superfamily sugar epimerase
MATTYRSPLEVPANAGAVRTIGQALYFLVTPEAGVLLHRIWSDQVYHHYAGDPLEVLLLPERGEAYTSLVGADLGATMRPQLLIPAGTFHAGRVRAGGEFALLGTTSWPGVAEGEFELGDVGDLQRRYPELAIEISSFSVA